MTAMLEVLGQHLPAVERDLIVAGFHLHDIGTVKLSWAELESFIFAAPPGTATHTSRTGSWNADAQQLAATRMIGYGKPPAGGVRAGAQPPLQNRPGQNLRNEFQQLPDTRNRQTKNLMSKATAMPLNQFKDRMEQRHAAWRAEREKTKQQQRQHQAED